MKFGGEKPKLKNPEDKDKLDISYADGVEVMQNLEISEQNIEFTQKMADLEAEYKKRSYIEKMNNDTGKVEGSGPSKFEGIKGEFLENTKKQLTHPSKFVKGSIIAGVLAAGIAADLLFDGPVQHMIDAFADSIIRPGNADGYMNVVNGLGYAEIGAFFALTVTTIQQGIRAVSQTIKSKVATNQKMQRFIGMVVGGANEQSAKRIVNAEADRFQGHKEAEQFGYIDAGKGTTATLNLQQIRDARTKLDEMGIERIDRSKYSDNKDNLYNK